VVSKKDWVFFAKRTLLPQLGEDWVVLRSGHLARSGDDWMVQVAYYNPAAFPHEAKLLAFVVPLFVRSSSFNLNWHILSRQRFDWSAEDWMDGAAAWFSTEATHFWRDWGTTAGFMAQLDAKYFAPGPENWFPSHWYTVGYAHGLPLLGRAESIDTIRADALAQLGPEPNSLTPLRQAWNVEGQSGAMEYLADVRDTTMQKLGLQPLLKQTG